MVAMPELPEVEVIARRLRKGSRTEPAIVGRRIEHVKVTSTRTVVEPSRARFIERLTGARFMRVERRAKYLLLFLDAGVLVVHLRMTGDLHVVTGELPKFARV